MSETLNVKRRDAVGSRASSRLRRAGQLPAVLYGHKEAAVSLTVSYDELAASLRHGAKVVQLAGDVSGQALLQDLQWDTFGREVLHADLLRIEAGEQVHVEIEVEAKGESLGEQEGGVLTWVNHSVEIEVTPANIPEKLHIDISEVKIGDTVTAEEIIDLPSGAKLLTAPERVLLNCVPPVAEEPEEDELAAATEPELVGGEESEDDQDASGDE